MIKLKVIYKKSCIERCQIPLVPIFQFVYTAFTVHILAHTATPGPRLNQLGTYSLFETLPDTRMP